MNSVIFCAALMASMANANARSWLVEGSVKEPCAVAVSLESPLHFHATRGDPGALANELRVHDANGTEIPYSSGRFSQRSAFAEKENKVYFGVNTETAQPQIYVYDVKTGSVSEGVKIAEGYFFEQIRILEGDTYTVVK